VWLQVLQEGDHVLGLNIGQIPVGDTPAVPGREEPQQ